MRSCWLRVSLLVLGMGCVGEKGQDTVADCGDSVFLVTRLLFDPTTGEARPSSPLPHASLRSLRVVDWGGAEALTVEVAPGHRTRFVPGADQAGYPPGEVEMGALRWEVQGVGVRAPLVSLRGTCGDQLGG